MARNTFLVRFPTAPKPTFDRFRKRHSDKTYEVVSDKPLVTHNRLADVTFYDDGRIVLKANTRNVTFKVGVQFALVFRRTDGTIELHPDLQRINLRMD